MSEQVIDFVRKRSQYKQKQHGAKLKIIHNEIKTAFEKLLHEASRSDYSHKLRIEDFLFGTLKLRRNSKEAVLILTRFTAMDTRQVIDSIIWYSKNVHIHYDAKKGKVSKYFLACITNYLESKTVKRNEVLEESQQHECYEDMKYFAEHYKDTEIDEEN